MSAEEWTAAAQDVVADDLLAGSVGKRLAHQQTRPVLLVPLDEEDSDRRLPGADAGPEPTA